MQRRNLYGEKRLVVALAVLLAAAFAITSTFSYWTSRNAIHTALVDQDLPLTSSNIYSEIQKDLVRPILISATMAHDTFVRDWVLRGEKDVEAMARYLKEVKLRHGAFSSFFISEKTRNYYYSEGILKRVSFFEPRDAWYYRVRGMNQDYEINVDPDLANADALTIFINYRAYDYEGNFIGATGIGLTVDAVQRLVRDYQQRFDRRIYFVDGRGHAVVFADPSVAGDVRAREGIGPLVEEILRAKRGSWQYEAAGDTHVLHVNYLPELKWYLFVEQNESKALARIRHVLYVNLSISFFVTLLVAIFAHLALARYQRRLDEMATTDELTGLLNRHAFGIISQKLLAECQRHSTPLSILMLDIDHFKRINDEQGHLAGDAVLAEVAQRLQKSLRASDVAVRWGGEEFLIVLKGCGLEKAKAIAEKLRHALSSAPIVAAGKSLSVTASIGVTEYQGKETLESFVDRADGALYAAKRAGRNRVATA
ncbi:MAG: sensor domain-containing diguanylate cyclase [Rhodocyclaceae bacterium]|nr:sensor domain-containing diguanylate cyclase [Rhodocyclaceae bacterium]